MQSFTIFNSSAVADHINILFYFPSTTLWKWLRWLTIALDIAHAQKCLMKGKWISKIFQDLMKKSGTFQGPLLNSRTFQDIYLLKIQDLFKIVQTMQLTESLKQVN